MSWTGTMGMLIQMQETLETDIPAASSPIISHSAWGTAAALSSSSTPVISKGAFFSQALTAGAATIDLTSLTGTNGIAVTMSGLKVQRFVFINGTITGNTIAAGTNSAVTIAVGAANPYDIFGSAAGTIVVGAGDGLFWTCNETLEDVDATHCEIDLAGTATDAFLVAVLAG